MSHIHVDRQAGTSDEIIHHYRYQVTYRGYRELSPVLPVLSADACTNIALDALVSSAADRTKTPITPHPAHRQSA
jgi:hypothetical protein